MINSDFGVDLNFCYRCKKCKRQYSIKGADGSRSFGYLPEGAVSVPKRKYNRIIPFCKPCWLVWYDARKFIVIKCEECKKMTRISVKKWDSGFGANYKKKDLNHNVICRYS